MCRHHLLPLLALPFTLGAVAPRPCQAQWQVDGAPVCTDANDLNPTIASDGAGGAIITWMDYHSGTGYDIYAQRLNADGVAQWTADGVALCTAASEQITPMIVSNGAGGAIVTWQDVRSGTPHILATEREFPPGTQVLDWDGRNNAGVSLPNGVYFVEVRVGTHSEARRAILLH
jgi:hypothetical protein